MRIPLACLALLLGSACQPTDSPDPVPADPGQADPAPADAAPPPPALAESVTANFRCGDLLAGAEFDNANGELVLTINTRRIVLPQAMAASGARYADADGNEFWNKGDSATLTLGGQRHDCQATEERSPWDEARQRGVEFRGLGTEPFWSLEVHGGPEPRIELNLDMGERRLLVPQPEALADGEGYAGQADDGSPVTLRIAREECSDGMSDQVFPAAIELSVGDQDYRGCGAFLQE
ncbi:MAG TPA: MliC family protein [Luteimonas sp.]|nr:MliC family protein [Luteimonas sp.]